MLTDNMAFLACQLQANRPQNLIDYLINHPPPPRCYGGIRSTYALHLNASPIDAIENTLSVLTVNWNFQTAKLSQLNQTKRYATSCYAIGAETVNIIIVKQS